MIQETSGTSITIDPTFWVAFFAFAGLVVKSIFDYKAQRLQMTKTEAVEAKTTEIAQKVDGAATAAQVREEALLTEIRRLNEARVALASAAPASGGESVAAKGSPIDVVIKDTAKTLPVDVMDKTPNKDGTK